MALDSLGEPGSTPKVIVTRGQLPTTIDTKQPPHVKKPFSTILSHNWCHTVQQPRMPNFLCLFNEVEIVLQEDSFENVWTNIEKEMKIIKYSKVSMSLTALIEGDFFNVYTKSGNIEMLSEGRPGIDNLYTFRQGVLRLELPKELYERVGLVGRPVPDGGRKHMKNRYAIELDLRQPSMVRGKKGFDRIVWAFKNVLTDVVTWLFYDCNEEATLAKGSPPIAIHHPITKDTLPEIKHYNDLLVPPIKPLMNNTLGSMAEQEDAIDILEWLGLVSLQSPRIQSHDKIDPYLSRYSVPEADSAQRASIVTVKWNGFLPGNWVRRLFVACIQATESQSTSWFAMTGSTFRTEAVNSKDGYTIMRLPSTTEDSDVDADEQQISQKNYILWEIINGSNAI